MRVVLKQKQSNTGSIHDIESDQFERVIQGRGNFAVVLASYHLIRGRGYTTHVTEAATIKQARKLSAEISCQIIDSEGQRLQVCNDRLVNVNQ